MDFLPILQLWAPYLIGGITVTLGLVGIGLGLGVLIGLPFALIQVYGSPLLRSVTSIYIWFFRGLPILVLLFLFYFGLFPAVGLDLPAFLVGAIVLGLRSAAYQAEIFRGALQSVGEGQMIAAESLGMTRMTAIRYIILPQSLRIALPGWSNEYPNMLTDSAICYAIGVMELLTRTSQIVGQTYVTMPLYLFCAGLFIVMNYAGMRAIHVVEKRIEIPGFGTSLRTS
jgi:amino acid ABC transporter membrane protein 1, PAAT family (TC 3.A.1.3.-)